MIGRTDHARLNSATFEGYRTTCSPLRSNSGSGDDGGCMGGRADSAGWRRFCCGCQFGGAKQQRDLMVVLLGFFVRRAGMRECRTTREITRSG